MTTTESKAHYKYLYQHNYTIKQLAALFNKHHNTINKWREKYDTFPVPSVFNRHLFFDKKAVHQFKEEIGFDGLSKRGYLKRKVATSNVKAQFTGFLHGLKR